MSMMISDLQNFERFVGNRADDRKVEISQGGRITLATKTASAISRMFAITENARTAIENNNRVRDAFVSALKRQFNVQNFSDLPTTVKAALVGSHAKTADGDFGFDAQGHVTSGKPLTARRISAVLNAVREINNQTEAAVSPIKINSQIIEDRKAALNPFIDKLFNKITTKQDGFAVPLWGERFHNLVRNSLDVKVKSMFANIGNGESNSLKNVIGRLRTFIGSGMGVMDRYWLGEPYTTVDNVLSPGQIGRDRFVDKIINELIDEFNAANPDLKLGNDIPIGMFKSFDHPEIKLNIKSDNVAKELSKVLDMDLLSDTKGIGKAMEKRISSGTIRGHRDDYMYGTFASETTGIVTNGLMIANVPHQFEKDFRRTSSFQFPGQEPITYKQDNELEKASNDITEAVTQGRVKKFSDLKGTDLQLVRFAMTVMSQSSVTMAACASSQVPFKRDGDDALGSLDVDTLKTTISYEFKFENGGITFICHCRQPIKSVGCNDNMYKMNQEKSAVKFDVKFHYTADQLDKISKTDFNALGEVERMDLLTANSREFDFAINIEE